MRRFDAWARGYLHDHADRLFKGEYQSHLRCKLNSAGTKSCRCWGLDKQRIDMPEDLRAPAALVPIVQVKSLWIMHKEVGLTLEATDVMCAIPEGTCPFADDNPFN